MVASSSQILLRDVRQVLTEARALVQGQVDDSAKSRVDGVLGLYETLRTSLAEIDDGRIAGLLTRIAGQIEQLRQLSTDLERIQKLRQAVGR